MGETAYFQTFVIMEGTNLEHKFFWQDQILMG
jgi:hypothetical protein